MALFDAWQKTSGSFVLRFWFRRGRVSRIRRHLGAWTRLYRRPRGLPSSWSLKKLGEAHSDVVVATARTLKPSLGLEQRLVRIEAPNYCLEDLCLTLILPKAGEGSSVAPVMFYARPKSGMAEPTDNILSGSICFWSKMRTICAADTPAGWIIY